MRRYLIGQGAHQYGGGLEGRPACSHSGPCPDTPVCWTGKSPMQRSLIGGNSPMWRCLIGQGTHQYGEGLEGRPACSHSGPCPDTPALSRCHNRACMHIGQCKSHKSNTLYVVLRWKSQRMKMRILGYRFSIDFKIRMLAYGAFFSEITNI
jgi:hypothetical protein